MEKGALDSFKAMYVMGRQAGRLLARREAKLSDVAAGSEWARSKRSLG